MAKQEVSAVQVQMAAAAGVTLLQVDDLPVPLKVAKSGALGVLEGMLQALAQGEVVLAHRPAQELVGGAVQPQLLSRLVKLLLRRQRKLLVAKRP